MPLPTLMIWIGSALALLGLTGLGFCIWRALAIRKAETTENTAAEMQKLVAINMAAVGIASIGLGCVLVGIIL